MRWKKGQSGNPNGRRSGSKNKVATAVKEAVLGALNADEGAVAFFRKMKNSKSVRERIAFAHVAARLLPTEVRSHHVHEKIIDDVTDLELAKWINFQAVLLAQELVREEPKLELVNRSLIEARVVDTLLEDIRPEAPVPDNVVELKRIEEPST